MPDPAEAAPLLERWLDRDLDPPAARRLATLLADPGILAEARRQVAIHRIAVEVSRGNDCAAALRCWQDTISGSRRRRIGNRVRRRIAPRRRLAIPIAIIGLLAAGLAVALLLPVAPTPTPTPTAPSSIATLAVCGPGTTVEGAAGSRPARAGLPLLAGDRIATTGTATRLEYPGEATAITLAPASALRLDDGAGGKHLVLDHGRLQAEVAPQPAGRPLVVATPEAEATVVGTRFTMQADGAGTRLEVEEGHVRLHDRAHDSDAEVTAGGTAQVSAASTTVVGAPPHTLADPLLGWSQSRFTDPIRLLAVPGSSREISLSFSPGGRLGYGAIHHDLSVGPDDQRLTCRVRVESCDDGAILDLQAVVRDGGSWYLGYAKLDQYRDRGWFTFTVPLRSAKKKTSPKDSGPYSPDLVVGCTLGISAGSATITVADLVLETDTNQESHP